MIFQFALVIGVIYLPSIAGLWSLVLMMIAVVEMGYLLGQKPYEEPRRNWLMIFNQTMLIFLCYQLMLFSDYVDVAVSDQCGNLFICATCTSIAVNMLYHVVPGLQRLQ